MNVNPLIEDIFNGFTVGGELVPVDFCYYEGKADSYITYYTSYERPENFFDDDFGSETSDVVFDVFSRKNFKLMKEKVKEKMIEAGFLWVSTGTEEYYPDTEYYHFSINFRITTPINLPTGGHFNG